MNDILDESMALSANRVSFDPFSSLCTVQALERRRFSKKGVSQSGEGHDILRSTRAMFSQIYVFVFFFFLRTNMTLFLC